MFAYLTGSSSTIVASLLCWGEIMSFANIFYLDPGNAFPKAFIGIYPRILLLSTFFSLPARTEADFGPVRAGPYVTYNPREGDNIIQKTPHS